MKLFGKICWMLGFVFMALAITLLVYFVGYINGMFCDYQKINLNASKSIIKADLAMAIIGTVSLALGFVLRLIAKVKGKKSVA